MLIVGNIPEIAAQAWQPVSPQNGDLSGWPLIIMGAGSLILGGGGLWVMHEKHTEKELYYECIEKALREFNMNAEEAKLHCSPGLEPRKPILDLGLNATTVAGVGALVFGLWYVTKLLSTAMKTT